MLSILIPTYNYNAFPLVLELHKQCVESNLVFEILCFDDSSTFEIPENNQINSLDKCSYIILDKNIGRSKIRNLLASKSNYEWLLYMDCDTLPENSNFISNYISQINSSVKGVFFGGIIYTENKPDRDKLLRWVFGKKREAIPLSERKKNPYKTTFISNFLIKKSIFETILFDEKINTYGYEDFTFIHSLKDKNIEIQHIENPLYHLNLETSELFISKTKTALETLLFISKNNSKIKVDSKLIKIHKVLSLFKIEFLAAMLFQGLHIRLEENLTSKKPSLLLFDFYKIGYFCYLNIN
ncbi:glycosyltransferase [Flavobacterium sp. K5-23]|uniref:glycosyltransferase family 2 protein n=1 Tax=Flavobacterium sp. K5-23 TaxID=2746225 RepID=UPI00200BDCEA|nr:glycosyltransferase [Flavobacterium sp. K5-23]UQD57607.1 glycosyltransferase [Flavobacterium sp. K5-23]